ncbi:MAG: hypothetical protein P8Y53_09485 [Pseudolabrys sp.]
MLHAGHRVSKDIDAFITDPQYLPLMMKRPTISSWCIPKAK